MYIASKIWMLFYYFQLITNLYRYIDCITTKIELLIKLIVFDVLASSPKLLLIEGSLGL